MGEPPVPDILYVTRENRLNHSLRYSLRSAINLPHRNIVVAGGKPTWLTNVDHVPVKQSHRDKWGNAMACLKAACERSSLSENFILMNDDFFVMRKVYPLKHYHQGPISSLLRQWAPSNVFTRGLVEVARILREIPDIDVSTPLAYNLHVPMPLVKTKWLEAFEVAARYRDPKIQALHTRTFYGNYWNVGGSQIFDVKITGYDQVPGHVGSPPFLSSSAMAFRGRMGRYIMEKFPRKSRYER